MKLKNNENNKENVKKKLNNAPYECSTKKYAPLDSNSVPCSTLFAYNMFIPKQHCKWY